MAFQLPTDPIELAIFIINGLFVVTDVPAKIQELRNGLAAKAEAAGRDMTPDEEALDDILLEASKRARDGR